MITSLVIVSRQLNGSAPSFRLPTTLGVTKSPVGHPLSIQPLTKCSSRNSFILKTIHFDGGAYTSTFGRSHLQTFRRVPELSLFLLNSCALFCAFLHLLKSQLICFQAIPHSLQTTRRS